MNDYILFFGLCILYALIFFIMALFDIKNIKSAFWEWKVTMREWLTYAIQVVIFLAIIGLIGFAMFG